MVYTVFPWDSFIVNISMHFWATVDVVWLGCRGDLVLPVRGGGGAGRALYEERLLSRSLCGDLACTAQVASVIQPYIVLILILDWGLQISHIRKKIHTPSIQPRDACPLITSELYIIALFTHTCHTPTLYGVLLFSLNYARLKLLKNVLSGMYVGCPIMNIVHLYLKKLGVPQLKDLHKIQMCRLMYNFTNDILPRSLSDLFITNANVHTHNTRQRDDPHISSRKTSFLSRTFVHQGPMRVHVFFFELGIVTIWI